MPGSRLAHLIERVVGEIERAGSRSRTVTVRVGGKDEPGDDVLVRFRRHGDVLRIQLVAGAPARAAELARELPHLREALGGGQTRVDIDIASGGQSQAGQSPPAPASPVPRARGSVPVSGGSADIRTATGHRAPRGSSLLDLLA